MADMFQQRDAFLTDMRTAHLSREVVFVPATGPQLTVQASISRSVFEVDRGDGVVERVESRDFIVAASALPGEPQRGARIRETAGDKVMVYEVSAPAGSAAARWADASRTAWRIHTVLAKTEDAT